MLLARIQEVKEKVNLLESEVLSKGEYPWESIKIAFEKTLPIIRSDAIEKFKEYLDNNKVMVLPEKRKGYGRRKLTVPIPSSLELAEHVVDYLMTCSNMSASKVDIYNAIKTKYPQEVQDIVHRSKGEDTQMSALEYRIEWACTILTINKKAIGRNQDPKLPKKHIKLISQTKFTEDEIAYLKKNKNSLVGYVKKN